MPICENVKNTDALSQGALGLQRRFFQDPRFGHRSGSVGGDEDVPRVARPKFSFR